MSRLLRVHLAFKNSHVQTLVRSKLPMSRLSSVPNQKLCNPKLKICATVSRVEIDRLFKRPYVQTFAHSKFPMSRYLCVSNQISCAPKLKICAIVSRGYRPFQTQNSCSSKLKTSKFAFLFILLCVQKPMTRFSGDQSCLSPDLCSLCYQTV